MGSMQKEEAAQEKDRGTGRDADSGCTGGFRGQRQGIRAGRQTNIFDFFAPRPKGDGSSGADGASLRLVRRT